MFLRLSWVSKSLGQIVLDRFVPEIGLQTLSLTVDRFVPEVGLQTLSLRVDSLVPEIGLQTLSMRVSSGLKRGCAKCQALCALRAKCQACCASKSYPSTANVWQPTPQQCPGIDHAQLEKKVRVLGILGHVPTRLPKFTGASALAYTCWPRNSTSSVFVVTHILGSVL